MDDNRIYNDLEPDEEVGDRQHLNPDGMTDAEKGANIGGVGGAIMGAAAGSLAGPIGMAAGAVLGGAAGALASGVAIAAIDKVDGDSATDHPTEMTEDTVVTDLPGVQTSAYASGGTRDSRDISPDATGTMNRDRIDNSTGTVVDHGADWRDTRMEEYDLPDQPEYWDNRTDLLSGQRYDLDVPENRYHDSHDEPMGNGIPGIQTGGHAVDGTPDTRGMSEKTADALTGDTVDDKTGKRIA